MSWFELYDGIWFGSYFGQEAEAAAGYIDPVSQPGWDPYMTALEDSRVEVE